MRGSTDNYFSATCSNLSVQKFIYFIYATGTVVKEKLSGAALCFYQVKEK